MAGSAADLILHNARVITWDAQRPYADLVAIRGERILATGSQDDLGRFQGPGTRLIDCEGGGVMPGINDAHCHPLALAVALLSVDCAPEAVEDIAGITAAIRRRAAQTAEGEWIRAANYDEFHLREKRPPTARELDRAAPHHPVILMHRTAGHCVLNSLALKRAAITRDTPDPPGGTIHRDPVTDEPSGLIIGRNARVEAALPPIAAEELIRGMKLATGQFLAHGITSLQDTGWNNGLRHWQEWRRLIECGAAVCRVSVLMGIDALDELPEAGLSMDAGDSRLRIGGIKLALDESTGCAAPPQEDVNRQALRAARAGFSVGLHVSDVPMLEGAIAAIQYVSRQLPVAKGRFRLEHCTVCPPELLLKARACRAIVVAQPAFLRYMGQPYLEQATPQQAGWFLPLGSLRRWGVRVALSSDAPLVPCNPWIGIEAAVSRRTDTGQILACREGVTLLEALEMYTQGGAQASFEADRKGRIGPGMLADLMVLNRNPVPMEPGEIQELRVVRCLIGGKVVRE
ncbi:MAG: amidohydrolase [Steroidobacteraceae bacterium]|nr:amidohydrolase [Steroidobacteraceae bacterium]